MSGAQQERERLIALVERAKSEDTRAFGHLWPPDFAVTLDDLLSWLRSGAKTKPKVTKFVDDSI